MLNELSGSPHPWPGLGVVPEASRPPLAQGDPMVRPRTPLTSPYPGQLGGDKITLSHEGWKGEVRLNMEGLRGGPGETTESGDLKSTGL